MSLMSTLGALNVIRTHLLTYAPLAGGPTLATTLGATAAGSGTDGKMFLNQPPEDLTGFWAVLRLLDAPQGGMDGGFMLRCTTELILYAHGRKHQSTVERMADVVQEAWLRYSHTEVDGVLIADRITNRFSIPYESDPADRALVAIRLLLPFRLIPQFLAQHAS